MSVRSYLELNAKDEALRVLEQAVEERRGYVNLLKVLPDLDPLRGEPRFQALVKRVGLDH